MEKLPPKIILLDFDGVIVDSFQMCLSIIRGAEPSLSPAKYRRRFEGNIINHAKDMAAKKVVNFFAQYTPKILQIPPYQGMPELISALARQTVLAIISSTDTAPITAYLKKFGLSPHISAVLGGDLESSKVKKLHMALTQYDAKPSEAVFITDTLGDIRESHAAQVSAIAVTWGYHDKATLAKGQPDTIVETVPDLSHYFDIVPPA